MKTVPPDMKIIPPGDYDVTGHRLEVTDVLRVVCLNDKRLYLERLDDEGNSVYWKIQVITQEEFNREIHSRHPH